MSFKIFTLQLLGKIKPVEKIESQRKALWDDYNEFIQVKNSEELTQFLDLEKQVNSEDFRKRKAEIQSLQFKNSKQYNLLKEYEALKKKKSIKKYFEAANSSDLKRFQTIRDSEKLKEYEALSEYVKEGESKQKKDEKWRRYNELKKDADIKFFHKYEKSAKYKNYLDVKDSFDLKRYRELEEIISSKEFNERKAYLEDKNKWEKTDDYVSEKKYLELKNKPHLAKYFKYKGSNAFAFFNEWEVSFEENFSSTRLDDEKWSLMPLWAEKMLGRNYALPGDMHVYTFGKNIKTAGKLVIETRKEKAEGIVWKMPAGFVPQEFDYTSGLVSSAKSFSQNDGIFEAKIKFSPVKEVVSSCVLQGENNSERVYLLEMGAKNRLGVARTANDGKLKLEGLDISNLNKNKWYIFTLEKASGSFTWKINDTEVHKMEHNGINFPLHMDLMTLVLDQISGSKLPVEFQTEWVRCYKRKN